MFDWVTSAVEQTGYLGIFAMMLAENVFPPIPSEVIMPLAGFSAGRGELNIALVVLAGTAGAVAGAWLWYLVGAWLGQERIERLAHRHGRWLTITPKDFSRARAWFDEHGGKMVFLGRLMPVIRTFISVPAGIVGMGRRRFLLLTSCGTLLWTMLLTLAGYWLGDRHELVSTWMKPIADGVLGLILVTYAWRVVTFRRRHPEPSSAASAERPSR